MIWDAIAAEQDRLYRNGGVLFWAFVFPALAWLALGLMVETIAQRAAAFGPPSIVEALSGGLGVGANVLAQAFFICGAAVMFAGDYRWGTWRALVVRCGRTQLMLAKVVAFAGASAMSISLCALAGLAVALYSATISGQHVSGAHVGAGALVTALGVAFASSLLQILWAAGIAALAAALTRSLLTAALAPFLTALVLWLAGTQLSPGEGGVFAVLLPAIAGRGMHDWSAGALRDPDAVAAALGPPGALAMSVETAILFAVAIALFQRQDLTKE